MLNRKDLLFLREFRGWRGIIEGSKPHLRAQDLERQGLVQCSAALPPMRSMSFPGELRRPLLYQLTDAGKIAAKQRLPMQKRKAA